MYRNRGTQALTSAVIGTQEVMSSVAAGNLTTICVFIPFFVFKNKLEMLGQMFSSLMSVILIAILSSLFVAVFLVPVLAGKFLPVSNRKEHPIKNKFLAKCDKSIENAIDRFTDLYRKGLRFVLHRRFAAVFIAAGVFVASLVLIGRLNISFMSTFNDTSVSLNVTLPLGTKLEETQSILDDFYQFAQDEIEGYENIVVSVGSGGGMSMSDTSYKGSLTVYLPDVSKQIDNAQTVKEKLRKHFDSYPAATLTFNEGMMQQMSGNDVDIVFRSNDLDASVALAKEIQELIKTNIPSLTEPQIDMQDGLPQVEIKVDRERAYSFGISIMSIANEINYCINGTTATTYHKNGDSYDVVVLLKTEDRDEIPDLEKIYVSGRAGLYSLFNTKANVKAVIPLPPDLAAIRAEYFASAAEAQGEGGVSND